MKKILIGTCVIHLAVLLQVASAHYLWVTVDPKSGDHGTVNVYFEGGPGPGDGHYLDPFIERGKHWIRTGDAKKPADLKLEVVKKPKQRWLSAKLDKGGNRAIESFTKFGVYRYEKAKLDVLLHYYGRHIDGNLDYQRARQAGVIARRGEFRPWPRPELQE